MCKTSSKVSPTAIILVAGLTLLEAALGPPLMKRKMASLGPNLLGISINIFNQTDHGIILALAILIHSWCFSKLWTRNSKLVDLQLIISRGILINFGVPSSILRHVNLWIRLALSLQMYMPWFWETLAIPTGLGVSWTSTSKIEVPWPWEIPMELFQLNSKSCAPWISLHSSRPKLMFISQVLHEIIQVTT